MMRVFIADDEDIIRDGIRGCIEKESDRFLFAGEAPDGEMALPMIVEMKPDILITDIRMPFLDGLELARVVRRAMPWVRVIFLSGHDEFEYAQQAVSLHADAYLLKPIDSTQLIATLEQVAARIEQEQQQYLSAAQRGRSEQEEDALREHFFNQLLSGGISTAQAIEHGARFGAALTARQYLVCMMRLPKDRDTRMQVRALASHTFDGQDDVFCFFRGSTRLMLLLLGENKEAVREHAYEVCQNLRHEIHKVLGPDTLTAIGLPVSRLSALPDSYQAAQKTMLQAAACAESGVFGSTDFAAAPKAEFDFSQGGSLADKLRHAAPEDVPQIVDTYFGDTAAQDMQSVLYRYYLLMDLLVTASRLAAEVQPGSIAPPDDPQAVLSRASTLEGTKAYAAEVLTQLTRLCYRHKNVRYSAEIGRAKAFIRANYADSGLSLHMVAAEVGFSPNHFSTVFSQETGQTFVEYLTEVRLEAAKELLAGSDARMSDIAFDVGYQEPHYFSYLFKKHVGMSPREYRNRAG